jgi:hypothetical protein
VRLPSVAGVEAQLWSTQEASRFLAATVDHHHGLFAVVSPFQNCWRVPRAPTSFPVAEPGVMMGLEINTLAMQGCRGGARRCRFVEMWLLTVVGLPV